MGKQLSLFRIEKSFKLPEGFQYYPDVLSAKEEEELIAAINNFDLHNFQFRGIDAKRKVASFGYDYDFERGGLKKGEPIPDVFQPLIQSISRFLSIPSTDFKELLVTEYPEGSVINWHKDAPPFETIVGISLGADCQFRLRPFRSVNKNSDTIRLNLERRSLYVIKGEARENWEHSILPVSERRYSITLRTLRKKSLF